MYRRWVPKADLVVAALARLGENDVDLTELPDTGSLRGDMAAMVLPHTAQEQQFRIRIVTGLLALSTQEPRLADAAAQAGVGRWTAALQILMRRAIDRGEFPPADVDTIASVIPLMCIARAVLQQPITPEWSLSLIEGVVIPALRGGR